MIVRADYLVAYRAGQLDAEEGKPPECGYDDTELVEAYYEGYDNPHNV